MALNAKSFSSFKEFKSSEQLFNAKPLVIIDQNCLIKYGNSTFEKMFALSEGESLAKLEADLQLEFLIDGFAKSKYGSFHFDLLLSENYQYPDRAYKIDVERALIDNQEYFILLFNSVEELKKIEERIYYLINAIDFGKVAIIITDKWGFIKYTSRSSEEILKNTIEQLFNNYLPEALSSLITPQDIYSLEESLKGRLEWQCISSTKNEKGKDSFRKLRLSPVQRSYEDITNFILTFNDVTEHIESEERLRKAYEKESELNRLKSAFLANMSHEIRTPSTAIIGFANILREDIKSGNYENSIELVNFLDEGIQRMIRLFDNIIEVSLMESGDYVFDYTTEDVHELLEKSCAGFESLAELKNVNIVLDVQSSPVFIQVDKAKFNKIIDSILDNAIKYNKPNGSVIISTENSIDYVTIIISDSGRGIEKSKIESVLQPFVQEEFEGHKRNYEGAGLGLTVAYKLTKLLKGDLNILSRKGSGTSVFIKFPLIKK